MFGKLIFTEKSEQETRYLLFCYRYEKNLQYFHQFRINNDDDDDVQKTELILSTI